MTEIPRLFEEFFFIIFHNRVKVLANPFKNAILSDNTSDQPQLCTMTWTKKITSDPVTKSAGHRLYIFNPEMS